MGDRNEAVRKIFEEGGGIYHFNPADGTITRNKNRIKILLIFDITKDWHPVFDCENQYIGFNAGEHGFISKDVAVKEMGI
jgi:hypothetical protein